MDAIKLPNGRIWKCTCHFSTNSCQDILYHSNSGDAVLRLTEVLSPPINYSERQMDKSWKAVSLSDKKIEMKTRFTVKPSQRDYFADAETMPYKAPGKVKAKEDAPNSTSRYQNFDFDSRQPWRDRKKPNTRKKDSHEDEIRRLLQKPDMEEKKEDLRLREENIVLGQVTGRDRKRAFTQKVASTRYQWGMTTKEAEFGGPVDEREKPRVVTYDYESDDDDFEIEQPAMKSLKPKIAKPRKTQVQQRHQIQQMMRKRNGVDGISREHIKMYTPGMFFYNPETLTAEERDLAVRFNLVYTPMRGQRVTISKLMLAAYKRYQNEIPQAVLTQFGLMTKKRAEEFRKNLESAKKREKIKIERQLQLSRMMKQQQLQQQQLRQLQLQKQKQLQQQQLQRQHHQVEVNGVKGKATGMFSNFFQGNMSSKLEHKQSGARTHPDIPIIPASLKLKGEVKKNEMEMKKKKNSFEIPERPAAVRPAKEKDLMKLLSSKARSYRTKETKEKELQRRLEEEARNESITAAAVKANVEVKKIMEDVESDEDELQRVRNPHLMRPMWGQINRSSIGVESDEDDDDDTWGPNYFDSNLVFENLNDEKDGEEEEEEEEEEEIEAKNVEKKKEDDIFGTMFYDFNISRDQQYEITRMFSHKERVGKHVIKHAYIADELDPEFYPTHYTHVNMSQLPHPSFDFTTGTKIPLVYTVPRRSRKRLHREKIIKREKDMTTDNHRVILLESVENEPSLINIIGMGSRIVNYIKTQQSREEDQLPPYQDGIAVQKKDRMELPVMGDFKEKEYLTSIENSMYAAQMAPHRPNENDFLLTLKNAGDEHNPELSFKLRNIGAAYTVGHIQERMTAYAPRGKEYNLFMNNRMEAHVKSLLKEHEDVTTAEVKRAFPDISDQRINKKLREFCTLKRSGREILWTLKEGEDVDARTFIKPEMVARYEAMLRGEERVIRQGLTDKILTAAFHMGEAALKDEKRFRKIIAWVEKEACKLPWNDSENFINMRAGTEDFNLKLIELARHLYKPKKMNTIKQRVQDETIKEVDKRMHMTRTEELSYIKLEGRTAEEIDKMSKPQRKSEAARIREKQTLGMVSKKNQKKRAKKFKVDQAFGDLFSKESGKLKSTDPFYRENVNDFDEDEFSETLLLGDKEKGDLSQVKADLTKMLFQKRDSEEDDTNSSAGKKKASSKKSLDNLFDDAVSEMEKSEKGGATSKGTTQPKSKSKSKRDTGDNGRTGTSPTSGKLTIDLTKPDKGVKLVYPDGRIKVVKDPLAVDAYMKRKERYKFVAKRNRSLVFVGAKDSEKMAVGKTLKGRLTALKKSFRSNLLAELRGEDEKKKKRGKGGGRGRKRKFLGSRKNSAPKMMAKGLARRKLFLDVEGIRERQVRQRRVKQEGERKVQKRKRKSGVVSLNNQLQRVVQSLKREKNFGAFVYSVSRDLTKKEMIDYRRKVSPGKPICLEDIERNCTNNTYQDSSEFFRDLQMIRDNCHKFCVDIAPTLLPFSSRLVEQGRELFGQWKNVSMLPKRRGRLEEEDYDEDDDYEPPTQEDLDFIVPDDFVEPVTFLADEEEEEDDLEPPKKIPKIHRKGGKGERGRRNKGGKKKKKKKGRGKGKMILKLPGLSSVNTPTPSAARVGKVMFSNNDQQSPAHTTPQKQQQYNYNYNYNQNQQQYPQGNYSSSTNSSSATTPILVKGLEPLPGYSPAEGGGGEGNGNPQNQLPTPQPPDHHLQQDFGYDQFGPSPGGGQGGGHNGDSWDGYGQEMYSHGDGYEHDQNQLYNSHYSYPFDGYSNDGFGSPIDEGQGNQSPDMEDDYYNYME